MGSKLTAAFSGARIIEDHTLVDTFEDWSRVRSKSRAIRRRRYGHRQNIDIKGVPSTKVYVIDGGRAMVMHPASVAALRARATGAA